MIRSLTVYATALILASFSGCSSDEVQGKPALKKPAGDKKDSGVTGMGMDPVEHMLMRLDKNKDNKLDASEIPGSGLPGFDTNKDGEITREEMEAKYERMRKKGAVQKTEKESKSAAPKDSDDSKAADQQEKVKVDN